MPIPLFHVFSDDRFMDLTLYQYGYEKCRPLHSFGPSFRNHFLFHYIFSGKGTLLVDEIGVDPFRFNEKTHTAVKLVFFC